MTINLIISGNALLYRNRSIVKNLKPLHDEGLIDEKPNIMNAKRLARYVYVHEITH